MTVYEEIEQLRKNLKNPTARNRNRVSMRMFAWDLTIGSSICFKRLMDILLSFMAIILLMPLMVVTAFLIKMTSSGSIIFSQARVGKYGRHFKFYKFRSMYADAEERKAELLKYNESGDGVIFKMKDDPGALSGDSASTNCLSSSTFCSEI